MKVSNLWRTLTRDRRRAWNAWAKDNKVLLDDGSVRRVSGRKAMTMVLRNRAIAGEAANPTVVPAAANWLDGALSLRDAGPFTENDGYIGFRCDQELPAGTKWFVWASALVLMTDEQPLTTLRFVTVMNLGAMAVEDVVPSIGGAYLAVHGDWHPPNDPPQNPPHWDPPRRIWFRLHHYSNGALSPGRVLRAVINYEL
jgi:hypothetical protein